MKLLFVNGDRGLVASHEGKFYFPDRKSSIKEEGVYDCKISIEKEKYAFVIGEKVKTIMPTEDILNEYFYMLNFKYEYNSCFLIKKIGNDILLFIGDYETIYIKYFDGDKLECIASYPYCLRVKHSIYDHKKFELHDDYMHLSDVSIKNMAKEITENNALLSISAALSSIIDNMKLTNENIKIYDNKFIYFTCSIMSTYKFIFMISENNEIVEITNKLYNVDDLGKVTFEATPECVTNYMIENRIGRGCGYHKGCISTKKINICGSEIEVSYLYGPEVLKGISDDDKKIVDKSFEELNAFRKKLAKNITKSTMAELHKLSPKNILGL